MLHFDPPTPEATARVLDACTDPALTLRDIALANNTTVEALSLWLSTPEIADRLNELHSITATRTRFLAAATLPRSIDALSEVLAHAKSALRATPATTPAPSTATPITPAIFQIRLLETTRRAATTLIALTRASSPPPPPWRGRCPSEARAEGVCTPDTQPTPYASTIASPNIAAASSSDSTDDSNLEFSPPPPPPWRGRCPSEARAEGVCTPDAQPTPHASTPALPNILAASPAPTPSAAEITPAPTPAALIASILAELSKLPAPAPLSDRPPLTPEAAAYCPAPGQPTLGQLETLATYLDSLHSTPSSPQRATPDFSRVLVSTTPHEHWP